MVYLSLLPSLPLPPLQLPYEAQSQQLESKTQIISKPMQNLLIWPLNNVLCTFLTSPRAALISVTTLAMSSTVVQYSPRIHRAAR